MARHYRFLLIGLALAAISLAITLDANAGTVVKAPPKPPGMRLAPPVACTAANRMDIFVDEDNILWACECEQLKSGVICRWQVIGGVDPVAIRIRSKIELGVLPKRFYWSARFKYIRVLRTVTR